MFNLNLNFMLSFESIYVKPKYMTNQLYIHSAKLQQPFEFGVVRVFLTMGFGRSKKMR